MRQRRNRPRRKLVPSTLPDTSLRTSEPPSISQTLTVPTTKRKRHHRNRQVTRQRIRWIGLLFILVALVLLGRFLYLQVFWAQELSEKAARSQQQTAILFNRGKITDRHGEPLAQDAVLYDLFAHPRYYSEGSTAQQMANKLASILQKPAGQLKRLLSQKLSTIRLASNVAAEQVQQLQRLKLTVPVLHPKTKKPLYSEDGTPTVQTVRFGGLDPQKKFVRHYPQGGLASHVLGYVNDEAKIAAGIEASAASQLKGAQTIQQRDATGLLAVETDGKGNWLNWNLSSLSSLLSPPQGIQDVQLTLDSHLQYISEQALLKGIQRSGAARGTAIMMAPSTGEVLAMAVLPTYQPDEYYRASYEELKNWPLTDVYPPGSTLKILTVACALQTGVIKPNSHILDTGQMKLNGWTIRNYDAARTPYPGWISLRYLFEHSSNVASAKLALKMPTDKYMSILEALGFGKVSGIDLPGEAAGLFKPAAMGDKAKKASLGYGYGLNATPIQVAAAIAAVANGGNWHQPHIIQNRQSTIKSRQVFKPDVAAATTRILADSIEKGRKVAARIPGLHVAGKTGTSRKPDPKGGYTSDVYTSFVGYFPAEAPKVLILVVVDSPRTGQDWGGTIAAPIFREIALETADYLHLYQKTTRSNTK